MYLAIGANHMWGRRKSWWNTYVHKSIIWSKQCWLFFRSDSTLMHIWIPPRLPSTPHIIGTEWWIRNGRLKVVKRPKSGFPPSFSDASMCTRIFSLGDVVYTSIFKLRVEYVVLSTAETHRGQPVISRIGEEGNSTGLGFFGCSQSSSAHIYLL